MIEAVAPRGISPSLVIPSIITSALKAPVSVSLLFSDNVELIKKIGKNFSLIVI